jgi:hypothetical protein
VGVTKHNTERVIAREHEMKIGKESRRASTWELVEIQRLQKTDSYRQ